jgi:hypothetical protein
MKRRWRERERRAVAVGVTWRLVEVLCKASVSEETEQKVSEEADGPRVDMILGRRKAFRWCLARMHSDGSARRDLEYDSRASTPEQAAGSKRLSQ